MSHICYIDESGDLDGLLSPGRLIEGQPVYAVLGLIVSEKSIARVAPDFVKIRELFAPGQSEVKGSDLRRDLSSADNSRPAGFVALKAALKLLESADARVTGRVCVKRAGELFDGKGADARALGFIAENFSRFLRMKNLKGRVVFDSRGGKLTARENKRAAQSMLRSSKRPESKLRCPLVFARSEDHVGLQLADWLCSALVAPLAATAYCGDCSRLRDSRHVHANYLKIRGRHGGGAWLWHRQLRFQTGGRARWGLEVDDPRGRSSERLFRASTGN